MMPRRGQLQRLGVDCIDLWMLRGFNKKETSVEDTMAGVKGTQECWLARVSLIACWVPAKHWQQLSSHRLAWRCQTSGQPLPVTFFLQQWVETVAPQDAEPMPLWRTAAPDALGSAATWFSGCNLT
jgi:hypothetical protein